MGGQEDGTRGSDAASGRATTVRYVDGGPTLLMDGPFDERVEIATGTAHSIVIGVTMSSLGIGHGYSADAKYGIDMHVVSVNVGKALPIRNGKSSGNTGIYKRPRATPVLVTPYGLEGDEISDTENHGGLDQAVYVYTVPDYAWWAACVGQPLEPGTFGENLTLSSRESTALHIGDQLRVGQILLEISAPRIPCVTIAARMGDPEFVKKFRHAERPGFYCRVMEIGYVEQNDPIEVIPFQGPKVSVLDLFRYFYKKHLTEDELRRVLSVPIAERARPRYEEMLAQVLAATVP
jgi:MOSC domain-containing protein YiiM